MKQITVRGIDDELSASVRRLADQDGVSVSQAALSLLRRGAGLSSKTLTTRENPGVLRQLAKQPVRQRHRALKDAVISTEADETDLWDSLPDDSVD